MKNQVKRLEEEKGKPLPEILIEAYNEFGNQTKVAEALGVSQPTVSWWLNRFGLREKTVVVRLNEYQITEAGRAALREVVPS